MILIGPTRTLDVDLILQKSVSIILHEPKLQAAIQNHRFVKVWRVGQSNAAVFAFFFFTKHTFEAGINLYEAEQARRACFCDIMVKLNSGSC